MDRKPLFVCTREDLNPWIETKEEEQENARREAARNRLKERGNIFKRLLRKIGVFGMNEKNKKNKKISKMLKILDRAGEWAANTEGCLREMIGIEKTHSERTLILSLIDQAGDLEDAISDFINRLKRNRDE